MENEEIRATKSIEELLSMQLTEMDSGDSTAIIKLKKEQERQPDDATIMFDLGVAYTQQALDRSVLVDKIIAETDMTPSQEPTRQLWLKALEQFNHVIELDSEYYGIHTHIGIVYSNLGQLEQALESYTRALHDDDEDFSACYYMGQTLLALGREDEAQQFLQRAEAMQGEGLLETH